MRETGVVQRLEAELDPGDSDEYLTATINEILRLRPCSRALRLA